MLNDIQLKSLLQYSKKKPLKNRQLSLTSKLKEKKNPKAN